MFWNQILAMVVQLGECKITDNLQIKDNELHVSNRKIYYDLFNYQGKKISNKTNWLSKNYFPDKIVIAFS